MDRRTFLAVFGATTALAGVNRGRVAGAQFASPMNVVQAFGFVPDGRTDNYDAFHRWVAYVNRFGGGRYVFPPGVYYVGRYRTTSYASRSPHEVTNPHILGCSGLEILGHGAIVRLNGRFHRPGRLGPDKIAVGRHYAAFMPFTLRQCQNVRIAGFEVDGGVRDMTRDAGVHEAHAHLISLQACSNVLLEDLDLHHSQTDGLHLSDDWIFSPQRRPATACSDIELNRVSCRHNARGGLAAIQVFGLTCIDCSFSENGFDLGRHGYHPPGFGVDIEPDRAEEGVNIDVRTGNIQLIGCEMLGNVSALLAAYSASFSGYLKLINCRSSNTQNRRNHIILCWPGALIQGGRHDAGQGIIWTSAMQQSRGVLTIQDCEILSSGNFGIFHAHDGNLLTMERVKLTGTHTSADYGAFPAIQAHPGGGRKNQLTACDIFLPEARRSLARTWDLEPSFNHTICENNLFRTNLPAVGGQHFACRYGPGTIVKADRFSGTNPGPGDSFRPGPNSTHDTRLPYYQNSSPT